jgi:hypothetical protein
VRKSFRPLLLTARPLVTLPPVTASWVTLSIALACSRPPPGLAPGIELDEPDAVNAAEPPIHIHDNWWPSRAQRLGTSEIEARQRDARIGAARAPADFWDALGARTAISSRSSTTVAPPRRRVARTCPPAERSSPTR